MPNGKPFDNPSPSLVEFLAHVKNSFRFLVTDYGFVEVENPTKDPFVVRFEKGQIAIQVRGYDHGCSVDVGFGKQDSEWLGAGQNFLKERRPDLWDEIFLHTRGQLKGVSKWADALPKVFPEFLAGDVSLLGALASANERAIEEARRREENPPPRRLP